VAAGVARVVIPFADPDPRVDGGGIARLRAAGVQVDIGEGAAAAREAHAGFLRRIASGRPQVTLKLAASLDGRIATGSGESRWITGPTARRLVHLMRARHDAVLVGGGTARADDPSLTVRGLGPMPQPVRVVASRRLDLPSDGVLARTARNAPVWLLHAPDAAPGRISAWQALGARCLPVAIGPDGQLDPDACLRALGAQGFNSVFCEGGGSFAASLLAAALVDELAVFSAGVTIGAEGRPALGAMGLSALDDAPRFALVQCRRIGADVLHVWRRPG